MTMTVALGLPTLPVVLGLQWRSLQGARTFRLFSPGPIPGPGRSRTRTDILTIGGGGGAPVAVGGATSLAAVAAACSCYSSRSSAARRSFACAAAIEDSRVMALREHNKGAIGATAAVETAGNRGGRAFASASSAASVSRVSGSFKVGGWFNVPELAVRDLYFSVPLDYSSSSTLSQQPTATIAIFVREVVAAGKEEHKLPCLVFLQGGPGYECARPSDSGGWLKKACEEYRVILLDQRGTGLSTPLTATALRQFSTAEQQASYLQHFRADNIVRDAEFVRSHFLPNGEPWTVLGQSFGGFCAVTYLSMAPGGLRQVLLTGGLPPLDEGCTAESVHRQCYKRVALQNEKFYQRFPQDEEIVRSIVLHLATEEAEGRGKGVLLPSGGILSPRGLQLLGLSGLGSHGGFERLHYILERAWDPVLVPGAKTRLSHTFLRMFENWLDFDTNPLYAILHEAIYCQGAASKWSAQRVRDELGDQFDAVKAASNGQKVLFTGEMIFPWMFDEIEALRPFKDAANILAEKEDWPPLYDKRVLGANKVPVAAAVYYEDLYVDFKISELTASGISGIRMWVTNEYMHSGLREDGPRILDHLFGLLKGKLLLR